MDTSTINILTELGISLSSLAVKETKEINMIGDEYI